jgi:hypothetical protein
MSASLPECTPGAPEPPSGTGNAASRTKDVHSQIARIRLRVADVFVQRLPHLLPHLPSTSEGTIPPTDGIANVLLRSLDCLVSAHRGIEERLTNLANEI